MTEWFLDHTIDDQGFRREVRPKIVLEVAFNNVMKIGHGMREVCAALSANRAVTAG
jgi:hypothetical protein